MVLKIKLNMPYTFSDIDKILDFKTWNSKKKIDTLLEIDATMYTNLGSDSTKSEIAETKKKSKKIYRAIKSFDLYTGNLLLKEADAK